jgi:serine/threonine protein kinase/tetratricopeptide (TPR) repeat protein
MSNAEDPSDPFETAPDLTGSIAGRFKIEARLGSGGMGEVYRAEDTQLKRTVAIKRLTRRPQNDRPLQNELLKEAQRASALNHPRIAGVYDVISDRNELFLVMEYVDGQTLRQRMEMPISISEFCDIATQCADALAAAHNKGILHGDLKPENIMLTREHNAVKVCDFGLARRIFAGSAQGVVTTVRSGIAGTPAYMAPEVVLEKPSDARSDIFSLGVVFYEMLSGWSPFSADNMITTLDRIREHSPAPLDRVNPNVPASLARIVARMIEKDPSNRYESIADILSVLYPIKTSVEQSQQTKPAKKPKSLWIGAAALVLLGAVAGAMIWNARVDRTSQAPIFEKINVAVLPITVKGATPDQQFFIQGVTEAVITRLEKLTLNRNLQVATASDIRSRNITNPKEARDQLSANVALSGSAEFSGTTVVVNLEAIDTRSGRVLRTGTVNVNPPNPLEVEARVLEAAVSLIGLHLSPEERTALALAGTQQPGAYDFYLQGRGYLMNYDRPENLDNAVILFRRALEIDSRYALAYAGLGETYWRKYETTKATTWVDPARAACEGALAINTKVAEAHACLGTVLNGIGQYQKAADEFNAALNLDSTNDLFYVGLANAYDKLKRPDDAERTYRRAIDLRPHYWATYSYLGAYFYGHSKNDGALEMFNQVVSLAPDSFRGYANLGAAYFAKEQFPEAMTAFEKSMAIRPNYQAASNLGTAYYYKGQYSRSAAAFRQALEFTQRDYQVWTNLADALFWAKEFDQSKQAYIRARELINEQLSVKSNDATLLLALASCEASLGEKDKALLTFEKALALSPEGRRYFFQIAVFYEYHAGRRDEALAWLSKAIAEKQSWTQIDTAPALQELRKDPRFQKLRNGS